ncbi:uncharacterized protein LOC131019431 [Salvia miltiorrhiza]|uniref:uncharacterized protein LOC131019431 n=1 Tax=Salvia miltiorrhiza TaxID=226208 RepID=UPI0025AD1010|nr:uncharacterized protein LOC131019431 [Salvia miltiorrhiza]
MDHILWSCDCVRPVWLEFLSWFQLTEAADAVDMHSFFVRAWCYKFSSQLDCYWRAGIITILWAIWTLRNSCIFDNKIFEQRRIIHFVRVAFKEMENSFNLGHMNNSWKDYTILRSIGVATRAAPPPDFIAVHWWPPVSPWIKVNTDGSAIGAPGNIAAGGVFRDNFSWVRGCFHYKGGVGFAFEAELLAVIKAIFIAHDRGWLHLWIESDSMYIVHLLEERSTAVPWRFIALWNKVLHLLPDFTLQISHIYRERNKAADIMANYSREEGWWPYAIEEIKVVVRLDMATHSHIRMR